jgi:hypothetical protein
MRWINIVCYNGNLIDWFQWLDIVIRHRETSWIIAHQFITDDAPQRVIWFYYLKVYYICMTDICFKI